MASRRKPGLAVWKFASCDGCQLALIDCEQELLALADAVEIAYFPEISRAATRGPYEISLVEGSISTPHDAERIHQVRRSSRLLVSIGACATAGGIQALRNFQDLGPMLRSVYTAPEQIAALGKSTPIADHVFVDYELRGCPVDKAQLIQVLASLLNGRRPIDQSYAVCMECKRRGLTCVAVSRSEPCMGPVTHAGCGALCPSYNRACYGCFGPKETPNPASLARWWGDHGLGADDIVRVFRTYNAYAQSFRRESEAHEPADSKRTLPRAR